MTTGDPSFRETAPIPLSQSESAPGRASRALIVKEGEDQAAAIESALARLGIESVRRSGLDEARKLFRAGEFDLVVSGWVLGKEDARALVHAIREEDVEVPVLVVSAKTDENQLAGMILESVDGFTIEPFETAPFLATVSRLLALGQERRRNRLRGAALLDISSNVQIGMPTQGLLATLARAVAEVTPFEAALVARIDEADESLQIEARIGGEAPLSGEPSTAVAAGILFRSGARLGLTSFFSQAEMESSAAGRTYSQARSRRSSWSPGDLVLAEIRQQKRHWGYLIAGRPSDGRPPSEDAMRMLSLLARDMANALDNDQVFRAQSRLGFQLEVVGEVINAALASNDLELVQKLVCDASTKRFGFDFACFLARQPDESWQLVRAAGEGAPSADALFRPFDPERIKEIEIERRTLQISARPDGQSLVRGRSNSASLAVPILVGERVQGIFVVEDDSRKDFDEVDLRAFGTLADQLGLVWNRILDQKYFESTNVELMEAYFQLQIQTDLNRKLQDVIRRYLPASTWESALQESTAGEAAAIEDMLELSVMFVDIAGFTNLSEKAKPNQIVALLNTYFTVVSRIISQHEGEVIKYIGDGVMAYFKSRPCAIRAADEILKSRTRVARDISEVGLAAVDFRIGVAYGPTILCHVGPFYYQDRTLLGDTVNTASRLESAARVGSALLDANLLPDGETAEQYGLFPIAPVTVKGKQTPLPVFTFSRDRYLYGGGAKPGDFPFA